MADAQHPTPPVRILSTRHPAPGGDAMKNPGTAAVLSLLVPGVGQIYNGDFLRGIFWLIVTPGMWLGTGGLLGWICHLIAAWTAHRRAHYWNRRQTAA
jgi:TM2 domain-containing membrane protein YozV